MFCSKSNLATISICPTLCVSSNSLQCKKKIKERERDVRVWFFWCWFLILVWFFKCFGLHIYSIYWQFSRNFLVEALLQSLSVNEFSAVQSFGLQRLSQVLLPLSLFLFIGFLSLFFSTHSFLSIWREDQSMAYTDTYIIGGPPIKQGLRVQCCCGYTYWHICPVWDIINHHQYSFVSHLYIFTLTWFRLLHQHFSLQWYLHLNLLASNSFLLKG